MAADTIFAVSSGRPPAAIAVIRISGPDAMLAGRRLAGTLPVARRAALRELRDGQGALLDRALVFSFPGPRTATGEDVIELHCHGGRAVVAALETELADYDRLRRAEPGEFTRRALANGRIDLLEAEGLADLLSAETETQRRAALAGAGGVLSRQVSGWIAELSIAAAEIEVQIDYVEEGDVAIATSLQQPLARMDKVRGEMLAVLEQPSIDRIRDGFKVVVAGPPNTGKSSLVNALAGRDVAIAAPIAGTTRDRLEAPVAREGVAFVLTDTAGLTETADCIEQLGIARAHDAVAGADIVLWTGDENMVGNQTRSTVIHLWTKSDLPDRADPPSGTVPVSVQEPESVSGLWRRLGETVPHLNLRHGSGFNDKQRDCIKHSANDLSRRHGIDMLEVAEMIRLATRGLCHLTGQDATDTMLDALFQRFCLGK